MDMLMEGHQTIVTLWHASLIYTLYHFRKNPAAIMVSASKDGEWVANALKIWGQVPVRGSRKKGGVAAIRQMSKLLQQNKISAGIVADGATGPAYIAQKGAVILARDSGFPIIPTGFAAAKAKYFNSWDRMVLPMVFSRIAMVYGTPIYVPDTAKGKVIETFRSRLEKALNAATSKARDIVQE